MPAYEFECPRCGRFELRRAMSEAEMPAHCPDCAAGASRVFSVPLTRRSTQLVRDAGAREERSRHEPQRTAQPCGAPMPHVHRSGGQPWTISH